MSTEVMAPGEQTLSELAATANREHGLVIESGVALLEHAIASGEALLQIREQLVGTFEKWLESDFEGSPTMARRYMRFALNPNEVLNSGVRSLNAAERYLIEIGAKGASPNRPPDPVLIEEARRLRASGMSYKNVAERIGVCYATVYAWLNPDYKTKLKISGERARKRYNETQKVLRKQEREQAIKRAVRKEGGALAEAYALVSKLDGVLGQARQEADDKERRIAVNEAHALRDRMMDQIVRALGVS